MAGGASDRSWLMEGVSPSVLLVPAQSKSRRLAAKACSAAWVRIADQRERREASTALRRMLGTALAFVSAKRRRKVVASGLHRPPVSMARTTSLHLLERRSSGYVRSLDLRASWSAAPAYWPARLRGWLEEVKGDTKVVSTASCAPPHNGSPLAITSILLFPPRMQHLVHDAWDTCHNIVGRKMQQFSHQPTLVLSFVLFLPLDRTVQLL